VWGIWGVVWDWKFVRYLVRIWHAVEMNIYWESGRIQGFASNIIVGYTGFGFEDDGLIE
jgi:hypothetical protein